MRPFVDRSDGFLYEQIATVISKMVANETLEPGDQLPSVREISRSRDVSISTAVKAYRLLEDRGLVEARPKSGFYVRTVNRRRIAEPAMTQPPPYSRDVECHDLVQRLLSTLSDPDVIRLGAALPDAAYLPIEALGRQLARVARLPGHQDPAYDPYGEANLRRAFAHRGILSGCSFDADDILVTNGCIEALSLSRQAVTEPGDVVAVESPTYCGVLHLLEQLGRRVWELPTSSKTGACLEGIEEALAEDVDALLLTPSFNNPIGSLMPAAHREDVYDLLCRHDVPLIEDDIYGDLYFGGARPRPIKALDREGRVLYCTSTSKTIAPGYRIGFVSAGRYTEAIAALKMAHTASTSVPVQRAMAAYLEQPGYEKRLRSVRRVYENNLHRMREGIAETFPSGTCVSAPQGGFLLWVEMPSGTDAMQLSNAAMRRGISVAPGPLFSCCLSYDHCLRLNGGVPWSSDVEAAIETLGELAHRAMRRATPEAVSACC